MTTVERKQIVLPNMVGLACDSRVLYWWSAAGLQTIELPESKDVCTNHPFLRWLGNNRVLIENSMFDLVERKWVPGVDLPGVPLAATPGAAAYLENAPLPRLRGLFTSVPASSLTSLEGKDVVQLYTTRRTTTGYQGPSSWEFPVRTRVVHAFDDNDAITGVMTRTPFADGLDQMNIERLEGSSAVIAGEFFLRNTNLLDFNRSIWASADPSLQTVTLGTVADSQTLQYNLEEPVVRVLPFYVEGEYLVAFITRHEVRVLNPSRGETFPALEYQLDVHPVGYQYMLLDHRRLYQLSPGGLDEVDLGVEVQSLTAY